MENRVRITQFNVKGSDISPDYKGWRIRLALIPGLDIKRGIADTRNGKKRPSWLTVPFTERRAEHFWGSVALLLYAPFGKREVPLCRMEGRLGRNHVMIDAPVKSEKKDQVPGAIVAWNFPTQADLYGTEGNPSVLKQMVTKALALRCPDLFKVNQDGEITSITDEDTKGFQFEMVPVGRELFINFNDGHFFVGQETVQNEEVLTEAEVRQMEGQPEAQSAAA